MRSVCLIIVTQVSKIKSIHTPTVGTTVHVDTQCEMDAASLVVLETAGTRQL